MINLRHKTPPIPSGLKENVSVRNPKEFSRFCRAWSSTCLKSLSYPFAAESPSTWYNWAQGLATTALWAVSSGAAAWTRAQISSWLISKCVPVVSRICGGWGFRSSRCGRNRRKMIWWKRWVSVHFIFSDLKAFRKIFITESYQVEFSFIFIQYWMLFLQFICVFTYADKCILSWKALAQAAGNVMCAAEIKPASMQSWSSHQWYFILRCLRRFVFNMRSFPDFNLLYVHIVLELYKISVYQHKTQRKNVNCENESRWLR